MIILLRITCKDPQNYTLLQKKGFFVTTREKLNYFNESNKITTVKSDVDTLKLVAQAAIGNRECMEQLLTRTRPKIFAYLYRLTTDYHISEDLPQQVQMEIVKSLWRLEKTKNFWPWILRYVWEKAHHHFRKRKKSKTISLSQFPDDIFQHPLPHEDQPGLRALSESDRRELLKAVFEGIKKLKMKQRCVVTMRCFEERSFQEIGEFLECSETNARVMFFRARRKIKIRLRSKGFKTGMLLAGLSLLGTATARAATISKTASAPVTCVSTSSMKIGFMASFIGGLTTEIGFFFSSICTAILTWITWIHLGMIVVILFLCAPFLVIGFLYYLYSEQ